MSLTDMLWYYKLTSPITLIIFIFSSILGSYMNVLIYRLPREMLLRLPNKSILESQRSYCPYCQNLIPWYLNIPIFAWLVLLGKTKCCKHKLSIQYPLVEFATAIMFVYIYWQFPFLKGNITNWSIDYNLLIYCLHAWIFCFLLLTASVIDFHHFIIPDSISIGLIATAPLVAMLHPTLTITDSLLGLVVGGGFLYGISWLYYLLRKEQGIGFGDVKLLAGMGGWLGYQSIIPIILYSSVLGTVIGIFFIILGKKGFKAALPFGPFLSIGAFIHLILGAKLMDALLKFHGL